MGYAKFFSGLFFGGLGVVAVACSDSSTSTPAVTADQACTDAVTALCAKYDGCAPLLVAQQYGDQTTCVARTKPTCVAELAAPGTSQTPASLEDCAKQLGNLTCAGLTANTPPDACKVKPGTVANGAACGTDAQCASTACIDRGTTGCGTCAPRVAAGGACGDKGQGPCDYGTTCVSKVCKKLANAGEACTASGDCSFGLVCKSSACAQPDATGASCTPGADDTCDRSKGFYCHPTKKQCIAAKQGSVNGACGFDSGGEFTVCVGGAYCKTGASQLSGVCTKLVADGGACSDKDPCQTPALCINGVCKVVDPSTCK
jgi:hypothetical protein